MFFATYSFDVRTFVQTVLNVPVLHNVKHTHFQHFPNMGKFSGKNRYIFRNFLKIKNWKLLHHYSGHIIHAVQLK